MQTSDKNQKSKSTNILNMDCSALASKLTENYYTQDTYNSSTDSLNGYFLDNGILLTMCLGIPFFPRIFGGPCKLGMLENHVSASWIRNIDTGFRIFGPPEPDELPIGLILDPALAEINCMYPLDAGTASRMNNGCGSQPDAPDAPMNYWRYLERLDIVSYKNSKFGNSTKWSDIDCNLFLEDLLPSQVAGNMATNNTECNAAVQGDVPFRFDTSAKYIYDTWSFVMGHPVCNVTQPWTGPTFNHLDTIIYVGSCTWKPYDWLGLIDTMVSIAVKYPDVHFWNEIVVAKPKAIAEITQAVFVMDGASSTRYDVARREALKLGKPLLILHHQPEYNSSISFTCDESFALEMD